MIESDNKRARTRGISPFAQTTILPPGSTSDDLQAAIDSSTAGDIIEISSDMDFLDIVTVPGGKEVTVQSSAGNYWTLTQATDLRHFENFGNLTLQSITLDGSNIGGGVLQSGGSFAMKGGASIQNCMAENGGGVYVDRGSFTLSDSEVHSNTANVFGGGVFVNNNGVFTMLGSSISGNKASRGGGVCLNGGALTMEQGEIRGNTASEGGGGVYMYYTNAKLTISGGEISGNTAAFGGGIASMNTSYSIFTFVLDGAKISGNMATNSTGGGLYLVQTSPIINNSDITNNKAAGYGGGIYSTSISSSVVIENSIISANTASNGGGVYMNLGSLSIIGAEITDNTVRENGGGIYVNAAATLDVSGASLITNNSAAGSGGGIYTSDMTYDNLTTGYDTTFSGNTASVALTPPSDAATRYPNIEFSSTSITDHPLNNYDINYTNYRVYYNANGGIGSYMGPYVPYGYTDTVLSSEDTGISRPSYTFTDWNTQPDGSGTSYLPGAVITVTGDVTLYAQWASIDPMSSITYDANGGIGSHVDKDLPYGSLYTIKSTGATGISRPNYTFTGWNTQPDGGGTSYEPGTRITITGDVTLYAQWVSDEPTYTVTYNANGGTGGHVDTDLPYGSQYTIKSTGATGISRPDYTFTGWNTQPDGSGVSYDPGTRITLTGDVTLYAQWASDPVYYTVTYSANGGTGSYVDTGIPEGSLYTIKSTGATGISRPGYTFTGWNTQPDGGGTSYEPGTRITITGDVTLYAQWASDPVYYTVTYSANGGIGSYADTNIPGGSLYIIKSPGATGISRPGYTFTGWNTQPDGSGTSYAPGTVITITGNMTLYTQWTAKDKPCCRPCCRPNCRPVCTPSCNPNCRPNRYPNCIQIRPLRKPYC